jgi:hypothetical protein
VTIRGTVSNVYTSKGLSNAAQVVIASPAIRDTTRELANVDSTGQFEIVTDPGSYVFEGVGIGHVGVSTDTLTLPGGTVWALDFKLDRRCPIVEP